MLTSDPITQDLAGTLARVEELQELHLQAQAYDAARQRTTYLHTRFMQLDRELLAFRLLADLASTLHIGGDVAQLRKTTLSDIRSSRPQSIEHLGRSLINNDLDLLALAEFVATSVALVRERRASATTLVLSELNAMHPAQIDEISATSTLIALARFLSEHWQLEPEHLEQFQSLTERAAPPAP